MERWDARASPRYQDLLILIEKSPNRTIKAPRMLIVTLRSLTSRDGIFGSGSRRWSENEKVNGKRGYGALVMRGSFFLHSSSSCLLGIVTDKRSAHLQGCNLLSRVYSQKIVQHGSGQEKP